MSGTAWTISSPRSLRMILKGPWVPGCWGPRFRKRKSSSPSSRSKPHSSGWTFSASCSASCFSGGRVYGPISVPLETDPEHVPDFPLVPVGVGPDAGHRGHGGLIALESHLQPNVRVPVVGKQVVHDGEIAIGLALPVGPSPFVYGGQVVQGAVGG